MNHLRALPIRVRLTAWYCVMFAAAALLLALASRAMLQRSLRATEYHELQERAQDVQFLLSEQPAGAGAARLSTALTALYHGTDEGKYLQVAEAGGAWLYRSARMLDSTAAACRPQRRSAGGNTKVCHMARHSVLILTYPMDVYGMRYTVQTGLALTKPTALLAAFDTSMLLLTPLALLMAALGGHWMSRKALAPVAAIAAEMRRIHERNLHVRLPAWPATDEIADLTHTLNAMLERVERAMHAIRDFTANAAHELRTPVALIRTEVEVALARPRSAREYLNACRHVQAESVRTTAMIDKLLLLARLEAGADTLQLRPFDAGALLQRVGERWQTAMQAGRLEFSLLAPGTPTYAVGDADALHQLLTILLENAARYTHPGDWVRLSAQDTDAGVQFSVEDSGIGIAADHFDRIFDRFYRAERGREGGSGLGLSLAQRIAESHDARLEISTAVGCGSGFAFTLPRAIGVNKSTSEYMHKGQALENVARKCGES